MIRIVINSALVNLLNVTVCSSTNGGNFNALINAQKRSNFRINCLIIDRDCGAQLKAESNSIPIRRINRQNEQIENDLMQAIPRNTDLIVLAGFLSIIPASICEKWHRKIINSHPSLLPKFGGRGMYGIKVHEQVMEAKEEFSGCTIHYVTTDVDMGEIILQERIKINYSKTAWTLGGDVHELENKLLVKAIEKLRYNLL